MWSSVNPSPVGKWTSSCCFHRVRWGRRSVASLCFLEHPVFLDYPLGSTSSLHELLGLLLSLLLVFGLCFGLLWLWSCSLGSSMCVPVRLPLEALSMSFDDLSTCIQVLSDTWKTGQQRLFRSWWLTMAKCSWAGLGWESSGKGSSRTFP